MLTKMTESHVKNWDVEMNRVLWAYRVAVKSGTLFSPFHLVYGKEAIIPLDVEIPALKFLVEEGYESVDCYRERLLALQTVQLDRDLAFDH